ncbi:MAG: hypothetical protein WC516_07080 [Patescibacteria group bacterium]|jgi:DNA-binding transcriptional regulator GbsR (MarR family)
MDELIKKFPELIKVLLDKLSKSEFSSDVPEIKEAKEKLLSQLQTITDEMIGLQNKSGDRLTEEQLKKCFEMRSLSK